MAGLAPGHVPICLAQRHLFAKFAVVRVFVATRACPVIEAIAHGLRRAGYFPGRMAFRTGNCQMRGDEGKPRLLMLCDRVRGGLESANGVALFAPVVVRRSGELAVVYIFVAIQALCKGDFIPRRSPCGNVAFVAGHRRVFALQWITCRRVLLHAERAWLPAIHRVAGCALTFIGSRSELASVGIRRMAVRALREGHRLFEVRVGVTFGALHLCVLSQQGKFRFRVVELLRFRNLFPTTC